MHLAVDALGMPVRIIVTKGTESDYKQAANLIDNLPATTYWQIADTIAIPL